MYMWYRKISKALATTGNFHQTIDPYVVHGEGGVGIDLHKNMVMLLFISVGSHSAIVFYTSPVLKSRKCDKTSHSPRVRQGLGSTLNLGRSSCPLFLVQLLENVKKSGCLIITSHVLFPPQSTF